MTEQDAASELNRYAQKVTKEDAPDILNKQAAIMKKVRGPLAKFAEEIQLLFSLVKDYFTDEYKEIPWTTIISIVGALIYVFSPIDFIPDFLPFLGLVDDAAVVGMCLSSLQADLQKYKAWKQCSNEDKTLQAPETSRIPDEEIRRLDEQHAEQMKILRDSLEQTTKTLVDAATPGTLGEYKYNENKMEVEDIQTLHKQLEKTRGRFSAAAYQLEKNIRQATQIGFDVMLEEIEKIKKDTGIYIDTAGISQKFDRVAARIEGSVTDVINRRVSLGDEECTEILGRNSIDEREDGLYAFLKKIAGESVRNVQACIDEVMWDALAIVAFVVDNRINDKKQQLQGAAQEFASMRKALSESEIAVKTMEYKEELNELDIFVQSVATF
jgi:uncharacterized membrane protein YkvA (DUF1232 family)